MKLILVAIFLFSCGKPIKNSKEYHPTVDTIYNDEDRDGVSDFDEINQNQNPNEAQYPIENLSDTSLEMSFKYIENEKVMSQKFNFSKVKLRRTWRERIKHMYWNKKITSDDVKDFPLYHSYQIDFTHNINDLKRVMLWRDNITDASNSHTGSIKLPLNSKISWNLVVDKKYFNFDPNFSLSNLDDNLLYQFIKDDVSMILEPQNEAKMHWENVMKNNYRLILSDKQGETVYFISPQLSPDKFIPPSWNVWNYEKQPIAGQTIIAAQFDESEMSYIYDQKLKVKTNILDKKEEPLNIISHSPIKIVLEIKPLIRNEFTEKKREIKYMHAGDLHVCEWRERIYVSQTPFMNEIDSFQWLKNIELVSNQLLEQLNLYHVEETDSSQNLKIIRFWIKDYHLIKLIKVEGIKNEMLRIGNFKSECKSLSKKLMQRYDLFPLRFYFSYVKD